MACDMNRLFKLQFLGPFALFSATLCAELAARALQYAPSSELLWFINLRMFGIFQREATAVLSYFVPIRWVSALRACASDLRTGVRWACSQIQAPVHGRYSFERSLCVVFGCLLARWRTHRYTGIAWNHCGAVGWPVRDGDHFGDLLPFLLQLHISLYLRAVRDEVRSLW